MAATNNIVQDVQTSAIAVVTEATAISDKLALFLSAKAAEIMRVRGYAQVRIGQILVEVKAELKEAGISFKTFLQRDDVNISEDSAERMIKLYRVFGKANEESLTGIHYTKLLSLCSLESHEVRTALLEDAEMRRVIAEATDKEVKAITQKLNERNETAKSSIEALKLELKTAKDEARHMLSKAKNEEKERTKQLETELQHLKKELATAMGTKDVADVDAVKQYREMYERRDAETKALARRYDDVTKQLERTRKELAEALETRVDGDAMNAEIEHANSLAEAYKAALDKAQDELAQLKAASLNRSAINIPSFDFDVEDCVAFLNEKGLFDEFVHWHEAQLTA